MLLFRLATFPAIYKVPGTSIPFFSGDSNKAKGRFRYNFLYKQDFRGPHAALLLISVILRPSDP
jgi:hypothetical protein